MIPDVIYHRLVSDENRESRSQTMAQACMGIGNAVVAGFTTIRKQFKDQQNRPVTVVMLVGSNNVLFGVYEFSQGA